MPKFRRAAGSPRGAESQGIRTVELGGQVYSIAIRHNARARAITLRTDPATDTVRATLPPGASETQLLHFVRSKTAWIEDSFARAGPMVELVDGAEIALRGLPHRIEWEPGTARTVRPGNGVLCVGGPQERVGARVLAWLKQQALNEVSQDLCDYCTRGDIAPVPVRLSTARRRWGSCSGKGEIRINWRLIMAPDWVRRSVVAHEVAHLRHLDHSRQFYDWFDTLYEGERSAADAWLRENGPRLHRVGVPKRPATAA